MTGVNYNPLRVHLIAASPSHAATIRAVADLLSKLRLDHAFVGSVARAAYLGMPVERGSIDVLALMGPEQKNQVAMMANNRGFRVERGEIEATEELDLIPFYHGETRVHVLVASNALYGRMVAARVPVQFEERTLHVPSIEDFALLLRISDDDAGVDALASSPDFDRDRFNQKLVSIGLGERILRA